MIAVVKQVDLTSGTVTSTHGCLEDAQAAIPTDKDGCRHDGYRVWRVPCDLPRGTLVTLVSPDLDLSPKV